MKNEALDILILGLLVVLFASIHRKRATSRLRCWVAGWLLVLLHFAVLLLPVASPGGQALVDSLSISALLLCALCFLFSASPISQNAPAQTLVAYGIGLPAIFFVNYVVFGGVRQWPLYLAVLVVSVSGILLAGRLYRAPGKISEVIAGAFFVGGLSAAFAVARHQPDRGILALLFELFLAFAAFYWFDFQRFSTGVLTAILGLVAWAWVFPAGLLCELLFPAAQITPGLWNVPKFFVAFGMVMTLLEDEFLSAARASEHYRLLFAAHPHPMWVQDPQTLRILEVNDAAVAHYGYTREEFVRMTLPDLRPAEDAAAIFKENRGAASTKLAGSWRHLRKDGTYIQVDTASHSIDYMGRPCSFVLVHDVTDRQQLHEQLVHQAHHDLLTGLPNRLLLEDRMQQSLAQAARHSQQAAVLYLDLDGFKQINDTYGHAAGDICLQQVVTRISARLRSVDTFARTGGDEFVIVLGELANKKSALMVARSVLESVSQPIEGDGFSFDVSASIGIAIYPDDGTDSSQLLRAADTAMYRAKQSGGDRYLPVPAHPGATASKVYELERFLRGALKDGGLEVRYQPQYSMGGSFCGLEALLRLNHPQLGAIPADRFLPIAEECNLVVPLGNWLLDEVSRQSWEWKRQRLSPQRISFEVSPLQFLHGDFSARVLSAVMQRGLDPQLLELIVTESTVMSNNPEVASQMRSLAALGVHFSVAHSGASYSCLSHLHQLPVTALRIDRSFVERISDPNGTYSIVQAMIARAHGLSLKVVAGGLERADQMECLHTLGCDFLQGDLLAPALPAAGVAKYLVPATPPMVRNAS